MRKLTVKNFSVIKDAELEFGKITVLIGPQSSGKSLLCKLAYFLSEEILDITRESLFRGFVWEGFLGVVRTEFIRRFASHSETSADCFVEFRSNDYSARFSWKSYPGNEEVAVQFSEQFESLYRSLSEKMSIPNGDVSGIAQFEPERVDNTLHILFDSTCITNPVYIPAARASFSNPSYYSRHLNGAEVDPILVKFDRMVKLGNSWNPNPFLSVRAKQALEDIRREMIRIAGGHVVAVGGDTSFRRATDGTVLPMYLVSSGTQELLPLFNVLGRVATEQRDRIAFPRSVIASGVPSQILESRGLIYVEEPEASVFPSTQYDLVRLFARMSNEPDLNFSWVITTHSPYMLTAFNTLIEAWHAGNKPGKREKAQAVIPERYWVSESDFSAYSIHDGVLIPIFKRDKDNSEGAGLIDGDYLDGVSDQLGNEFEQLLDIEYAD